MSRPASTMPNPRGQATRTPPLAQARATWRGKTYSQLGPAQRAEVRREDPRLFDRMRAEHRADAIEWRGAKTYAELSPQQRAQLGKDDPKLFRRLRDEWLEGW